MTDSFFSTRMNAKLLNLSESNIFDRLSKPDDDQKSEVNLDLLSKYYSEPPRKAAVLVPLLLKGNKWHILFIHRTEDSKEHSDQVAFPGGRLDFIGESIIQAALRETEEEIGLPTDKVKFLGELNSIFTISNYDLTPVVGVIPWPYPFVIQTQEVKRIFTIPLAWLSNPNHWVIKKRYFSPLDAELSVVYFNKYKGELLWGVSARITLNLVNQLSK